MKSVSIEKVLIANRGEIAVRIIRTCRELGIGTVAVYSDADRNMPHVLLADEAYHIGPSPARESYLRGEKIVEVALSSGANAIHPGYGFLSEKAAFASLVTGAGLIFIGPPASAIAMMGDKTEARKLMIAAGVPVVPGTTDAAEDVSVIHEFARQYGYPILIKAAAGGGGKGMRVVENQKDLPSFFRAAQSEAKSSFGDERVYAEKYLAGPRHIEFQILADAHGSVVHLGERECSIQRRHQKSVEESPSVIVDSAVREKMGEAAVNAARASGYRNAGTVEFIVDRNRNFYFLEVNTRLQVEHPVTELRTGLDLVAEQIRIAAGDPLGYGQGDIVMNGHAIECRIYAEDPGNNYLPSTGTITHLRPSQGFGIRDDRGVEEGGTISVYYDPMISKLVVWGRNRAEAIRRMVRALREYEIMGVATNIPLNISILEHPRFRSGDFDTHFLADNPQISNSATTDPDEEIAVVSVAVSLAHQDAGRTAHNGEAESVKSEVLRTDGGEGNWRRSREQFMRGA